MSAAVDDERGEGAGAMKRRIIIDEIKVEAAEAKRIIDEAVQEARSAGRARHIFSFIVLLLLILAVSIASGWAMWIVLDLLAGRGFPLWIWIVGTSISTAIIVGLSYHPLMRPFHRREMRQAMGRRGFDLCPRCGYWLKGLREDSTRCPECGARRGQTTQSEEEQ
jgi:hypothetical protein